MIRNEKQLLQSLNCKSGLISINDIENKLLNLVKKDAKKQYSKESDIPTEPNYIDVFSYCEDNFYNVAYHIYAGYIQYLLLTYYITKEELEKINNNNFFVIKESELLILNDNKEDEIAYLLELLGFFRYGSDQYDFINPSNNKWGNIDVFYHFQDEISEVTNIYYNALIELVNKHNYLAYSQYNEIISNDDKYEIYYFKKQKPEIFGVFIILK